MKILFFDFPTKRKKSYFFLEVKVEVIFTLRCMEYIGYTIVIGMERDAALSKCIVYVLDESTDPSDEQHLW